MFPIRTISNVWKLSAAHFTIHSKIIQQLNVGF